jgi:hypothetical protein
VSGFDVLSWILSTMGGLSTCVVFLLVVSALSPLLGLGNQLSTTGKMNGIKATTIAEMKGRIIASL